MSCKKWRWLSSCMETGGAALFLIVFLVQRGWNIVSIVCAVLMLAGIVLYAVKSRCPACGRYLSGRTPLSAACCPYCGAALDKENPAHK